MLADACLSEELMTGVFESVACLAAAALGVPLATYDERLGALWGDPWQAEALAAIRSALAGADAPDELEHPQPPVSFRILPRVLGNARRALSVARDAAEIALPAVSDNPVFLGDDIVSNGGFHNAAAPACIDSLTFALADFAQLAQHMVQRLQTSRLALPGLDSLALGTMQMVAGGFAEEARAGAVPSLLPLSGYGQTDVPAPGFFAFNRFERVRGFIVGSCTCLAVLAAHALALPGRVVPPALAQLHQRVLAAVPVVVERRTLGPELERLAAVLTPAIPE
jgi:histidine ammonia-lyase